MSKPQGRSDKAGVSFVFSFGFFFPPLSSQLKEMSKLLEFSKTEGVVFIPSKFVGL